MRELKFAARQTIPVLCGYIFLGIAFGLLLQQAGYGIGWALLASTLIYAGSMQFVLVGLLGGGFGSLLSVALTTLSVNGRHLFYGLSFIEPFSKMGKARPYMIFSLTDETYSLLCGVSVPAELDKNRTFLLISLLDQCYWVTGGLIGNALGSVLPFDMTGIDFAMTALFVVIFIEQWRGAKSHIPALAGAGLALVCLLLFGPDEFLLPTLVCSVLVLTVLQKRLSPLVMDGAAPAAPAQGEVQP